MSSYFDKFQTLNMSADYQMLRYQIILLVKNLFKKENFARRYLSKLAFFTKYQIEGDDRPDNVVSDPEHTSDASQDLHKT
jgi:hypothetical protein